MFRIGEFSKIAQVSIRMLRHYDQIGLFKPAHIDKFTSYRYYMAEQLPTLNKIIALKELGLSLEQIARFMHENPTQDELRGMLMLKKAQTEQAIRDELARLKAIETRIEQVDDLGNLSDIAIVLKSIPKQHYLSFRKIYADSKECMSFITAMQSALPFHVEKKVGYFMAIGYDTFFDTENIDIELGYLVDESFSETVTINADYQMEIQTLAPIENMVSTTFVGYSSESYRTCYNAIGRWLSSNQYRFAGAGREVMLQFPSDVTKTVTEIQFPVEKIISQQSLLD